MEILFDNRYFSFFLGLSDEEIKEKVLQSMIESGATPQAIAKVMVQQEILNAIGKTPDEMSKELLKQLRSGDEISLDDLDKLFKSGGISLEDAGNIILVQKALSVFNDVDPNEIARAILLQKGTVLLLNFLPDYLRKFWILDQGRTKPI